MTPSPSYDEGTSPCRIPARGRKLSRAAAANCDDGAGDEQSDREARDGGECRMTLRFPHGPLRPVVARAVEVGIGAFAAEGLRPRLVRAGRDIELVDAPCTLLVADVLGVA